MRPARLGGEQEGDVDQDQHQVARQAADQISDGGEELLAALVEQELCEGWRIGHPEDAVGFGDQLVDLGLIVLGMTPELADAVGHQRNEADKAARHQQDRDQAGDPQVDRLGGTVDGGGKAFDDEEQEDGHREGRENFAAEIEDGEDNACRDDPGADLG